MSICFFLYGLRKGFALFRLMTTNSVSDHCIPTIASRNEYAEESDFTKRLNSEIYSQASFAENEAITVEDAPVSSEDNTVGVELKQIKESSFFKEIDNSEDGDVHKMDEVDETEKVFQQVELECNELNAKGSLNLEEKEKVSEAQRLLEAEKKRLLAEIEHGSILGKSVDLEKTMERVEIKNNSIDNRSMEVELIDDIVLVDDVYDTKRRGTALNDKDVPRKHTKIGEEKPIAIDKGTTSNVVEGNASAKDSEFHIRKENNGRILYSREQLEFMRFANIVNQMELWSEMYTRILPEVMTEYESLVCLKNQKTSKSYRRQRESRIGDNLGTDEGTEDLTPENYIDDNNDYKSILKPAFEVEGEPDFSTGPPEDGFEYLRQVRWEAKGIPNVRVAKVDESKYIKKEQSVYMPVIPEIPKCPDNLLPVKEWEDLLLSDFLNLRQALSENTNWCEDEIISSQSGEDLLVEIFNKRLHAEKDESLGEVILNIQGMDSVTRISNLKKRVCLIEKESELQSSDCKWVVALCASLETPLDADTCACLRSLLRKCASVRAEKSLDGDEEVIMANMLITISGRYFGQMGQ